MRRFAAVLFVAVVVSAFAASPSYSSEVSTIARKGVVELTKREIASLVETAVQDGRYAILREVAQQRKLHLDPGKAKGLASKGREAVFIPVFDSQEAESGFLTYSEDGWRLSLSFGSVDARVVEGFTAKIGTDGKPLVEAFVMPKVTDFDNHGMVVTSLSTACMYVSGYGLNFGCWVADDNPFGYYYVTVYRYGTTPDPRSPSWWGCYQGYIHVCPRYESSGSPLIYPTCGFPPGHPQG